MRSKECWLCPAVSSCCRAWTHSLKLATETIPAGEVAWFRFIFQTLVLFPVVLWRHKGWPRVSRPGVHAARGILMATASLLFITALNHLPMAETVAIFFIEPLILTMISGFFLGERVGWRRIAAVLVGLGGALVIIRPSYDVFGPVALLPAGAALCFAGYLALSRSLSSGIDAITMQFTAGLAGSLVLTLVLIAGAETGIGILDPVVPDFRATILLLGMGGDRHARPPASDACLSFCAGEFAGAVPILGDRQRRRPRLSGVRRYSGPTDTARCDDHCGRRALCISPRTPDA